MIPIRAGFPEAVELPEVVAVRWSRAARLPQRGRAVAESPVEVVEVTSVVVVALVWGERSALESFVHPFCAPALLDGADVLLVAHAAR